MGVGVGDGVAFLELGDIGFDDEFSGESERISDTRQVEFEIPEFFDDIFTIEGLSVDDVLFHCVEEFAGFTGDSDGHMHEVAFPVVEAGEDIFPAFNSNRDEVGIGFF